MSVTKARNLVDLMGTDDAFRASVVAAPTREAKHALLESRGYGDVTPDDLIAVTPTANELSDAELEAVAGGETASWVSAVAKTVLASCAAIALAL